MAEDTDKSEEATPHKLLEARKKGQVAKSPEAAGIGVMVAATFFLFIMGGGLLLKVVSDARFLFSQSGNITLSHNNTIQLLNTLTIHTVSNWWPFIFTLLISSFLFTFFQIGPIFSFHPLKPDFKRINPVEGFKRLFSGRMLYEIGKSIIKAAFLTATIAITFLAVTSKSALAYNMSPGNLLRYLIELLSPILWILVIGSAVIAILDLVYSRHDFKKKMRMSTRDIKEEVKRREGDPLMRSKRKQTQKEINAQLSSLGNVKKADVLITNPTHLAVALRYDKKTMNAPNVATKASGDMALKVRQLARNHNVPIIEDKPLARMLFKHCKVHGMVPPDLFHLVAPIYINILRSRK